MNIPDLSKWLACLCACLMTAAAWAQQGYPNRAVQVIVPFAPGGAIDIGVRIVGPSLSARLGQPVVVLNRPGGGATIGMNAVAKSAPDGYTLGAASFAFAANPFILGDKMPYDSVKDLEPVTMIARTPMLMLVNTQMPAKSVAEFIRYAKARPGELNYGSVGIASSGHLITALFESLAGIRMTHVPFTTGPLPPLVANQIQLQFGPVPSSISFVKSGKLVAIGVSSPAPDPGLPDVPPISQTVPGFEAYEWVGLVAPAGTPREIIGRVHQDLVRTLAEPEVKSRIEAAGLQPVGSTPEELGAFIRKEMATWGKVARQALASEAKER
ncbi:MAG TPA: tripartite tricarboxylate transporter substrate binding protein [Burkholderiales bacterium]|nr:tripartite tricarboxylate transporter substrate binding protein [Burkholderiales bacterium]